MSSYFVPCVPKYFDIVEHFSKNQTLVCIKRCNVNLGDTIYVYVGKPYSEIMYRCHVVDTNVSKEKLALHSYASLGVSYCDFRYMEIKLDFCYPDGSLPLVLLKARGLKQVQRMAHVFPDTEELIKYVERNCEVTDNE